MKQIDFKSATRYLIPLVLFVIIAYTYFAPQIQGKVLNQNDTKVSSGAMKEIVDYRNKTGEEALWTNSMFGGMPAYLINTVYKGNLLAQVRKFMYVGKAPASWLIINFVGFFILLLVMGLNPWLSFAGALAYGFSSYYFIIIYAGHNTKADTMAFMAFLIAGVLMTFKRNKIGGGILTTLALSAMIQANHLQITYYTMLIVLIMGAFYLYEAIKNKTLIDFSKSVGVLVVATLLAVGSDYARLKTTMEYGKYSTRGQSELIQAAGEGVNAHKGLDRSYITQWSYGIDETFTLLIPNFRGGGSADFKTNTEFSKKVLPILKQQIQQQGTSPKEATDQANQAIGNYFYWGEQPGTAGPVYGGAIVMFLFVLGLFLVKGAEKWWLLTATIVSIVLSWGSNFQIVTNIFIDYFPGFNKFRTISMTLVIAQLTMPLLGMLALKEIFSGKAETKNKWKALYWAAGITGGLSLLFFLIPGLAGSFTGHSDTSLPEQLKTLLIDNRKAVLRSDAIRSAMLIALAAGTIYLLLKNKVKPVQASLLFAALFIADMWPVDKRYLNSDTFVVKHESTIPYAATIADKEVLKDRDADYRVLNIAESTFNDASTSYYHKSIGGYHGAKMMRYQELIERAITPELSEMFGAFKKGDVDQALKNIPVLNMMNTRYIIYNPGSAPIHNPYALGNAWTVNEVKIVQDANQEIASLANFNPRQTAIVDKRYSNLIKGISPSSDSTASVILTSYEPNKLVYRYNSATPKVAVFSEIYYPAGWIANIDGKPADIFCANYVLRALAVPAGSHIITFSFHPASYFTGNKISYASSIAVLLIILGFAIWQGKDYFSKK